MQGIPPISPGVLLILASGISRFNCVAIYREYHKYLAKSSLAYRRRPRSIRQPGNGGGVDAGAGRQHAECLSFG